MRHRHFPLPAFSIAIILLVAGISLTLFFSESFFQIKTVRIAGNSETVNTNALTRQKNLFLLSPAQLKKELIAASPWIEDIEIKKQFPSTLLLVLHERIPIAEYQDEVNRFFLDKTGRLLPVLPSKNFNSVQVFCSIVEKNVGQTVTNKLLLHGLALVDALRSRIESQIIKLTCQEDIKTIQLSLPDTTVLVSADSEPEKTVSSLQLLLKQFRIEGNRPETIDLRFEKPVVIPEGVEIPVAPVPDSSQEASQDAQKI